MSVLTAIFVDHRVACFVDSLDVIEPFSRGASLVQGVVQALLSQIFKHNLFALDHHVAWLDSAVLTATVAIRFNVSLVAADTLPEDVVGCKDNIFTKFFLKGFEVFDEVDCAV